MGPVLLPAVGWAGVEWPRGAATKKSEGYELFICVYLYIFEICGYIAFLRAITARFAREGGWLLEVLSRRVTAARSQHRSLLILGCRVHMTRGPGHLVRLGLGVTSVPRESVRLPAIGTSGGQKCFSKPPAAGPGLRGELVFVPSTEPFLFKQSGLRNP